MKDHSQWMGNLIKNKLPAATLPINKILIPGTHDSGTYGMDSRARTQSLSIKEQLHNGARYLDCRISLKGDDFMFYHWLRSSNKFGTRHDTPANNQDNVLYDIRGFLIANPQEVLILKFQSFDSFTTDNDYLDFLQMIRNYLEFGATGPLNASCKLVTLAHGTAEEIGKETLTTLNDKGMRVFLFFDNTDVPTDPKIAKKIWDHAFNYKPSLHKSIWGLWDPYWGDKGSGISVKDTDLADMETFWKWHDDNRKVWLKDGSSAGFYVLQSHMQELHPSGNGSQDIYFNISEQAADGNYYMNQDAATGDFESNNTRNIQHYIEQVKNGEVYNIITFDYLQDSDVCSAIVDYYMKPVIATEPIHYLKHISLKLNALTRYVGYGITSGEYTYPCLLPDPVKLYIRHATKETDNGVIHDGDEVSICTTELTHDNRDQLSVYGTNSLYYYRGNTNHERWTIRNGNKGSEIKTGDFVTFENKSYEGESLTLYGIHLTTDSMGTKPTRWIIDLL